MILQQIGLAVRAGEEVAFEGALVEVRQRVFASPGFRGFTVHQGVELPSSYQVTVLWETPEELLGDGESGRFDRCWAPVGPFLSGPMRVEHFTERPTLGHNGPGVLTDLAWLRD